MQMNHLVTEEIEKLKKLGWIDRSAFYDGYKTFSSADNFLKVSFPEDSWDPESGNREASGPWAIFRSELILKTLKKNRNALVWEVGAGDGNVAIPLREEGIETICIEPQRSGALILSKEGFVTYQAYLSTLKLPSNSISVFGCFDVLEHIEDPGELVGELNRVLTPGGTLLITVPAHSWLFSNFDLTIGHFRRYSKKSLIKELIDFEVQEIRYVFASLVFPAFFLRRLPYMLFGRSNKTQQRKVASAQMKIMRAIGPLLVNIFRLENRIKLPFGLSIYCVARKPLEVEKGN